MAKKQSKSRKKLEKKDEVTKKTKLDKGYYEKELLRGCPEITCRSRLSLAPPAALQKHLHSGAMRAFLRLAGEPKSGANFGTLFLDSPLTGSLPTIPTSLPAQQS